MEEIVQMPFWLDLGGFLPLYLTLERQQIRHRRDIKGIKQSPNPAPTEICEENLFVGFEDMLDCLF
jgi:hypothetical protein